MIQSIYKRLLLLVAVLGLCLSASVYAADDAHAQKLENRFGVGGMVGSPSAFNFQIGLSERAAIDFAVGGGFFRGSHFYTHGQFLWKFPLKEWPKGVLALHIGGGVQLAHHFNGRHTYARYGRRNDPYWGYGRWYRYGGRNTTWFGVRVPVGVSYKFTTVPVDVFMEFGPGVYFVRKPDFSFTYSFGARYWF